MRAFQKLSKKETGLQRGKLVLLLLAEGKLCFCVCVCECGKLCFFFKAFCAFASALISVGVALSVGAWRDPIAHIYLNYMLCAWNPISHIYLNYMLYARNPINIYIS